MCHDFVEYALLSDADSLWEKSDREMEMHGRILLNMLCLSLIACQGETA